MRLTQRASAALRAAGWRPGRSVPTHMVRAALIGAGLPAWPAALEALESLGGLRVVRPGGFVDFDVPSILEGEPPPDGYALIGRLDDGTPVAMDAEGGVVLRGAQWSEVAYFLDELLA